MRPYKKPKYKIDPTKIVVKKDQDLSEEDLYQEMLRSKTRLRRK
ncbi:MAG: hypothetical protein PHI86_03315 [Candidatus Omnitrophica bacterium]|nr:hypothetical protein [Candidatus Omnitrophota bacterium]HOX54128.1 hypothetical protein [Candidatus Omnitrophota bacterium]